MRGPIAVVGTALLAVLLGACGETKDDCGRNADCPAGASCVKNGDHRVCLANEGGSGGGGGGSGGGEGGTGGVGGTGGITIPPTGPGPLPDFETIHYGPAEGIPGRATGVGVDDGGNVYVIDGDAVHALRAGTGIFVTTSTGGQLDRGWPVYSVAGGEAGKVYLGFLAPEVPVLESTDEDKKWGDVDRMALQPDGTLSLELHYQIQNSKAQKWDHTRQILSFARVTSGPRKGDLYVGSNHGVTLIRGDAYADHRHVVWYTPTGSQAIGYVWGTNVDPSGNLLYSGHWKLAVVPPAPDMLMFWLDNKAHPNLMNAWAENLGSVEDPDDLMAIAGDFALGRLWVGAREKGLSAYQKRPKRWWSVEGTPDVSITSLEYETDGALWVGTRSNGLWRYDTVAEVWDRVTAVPAGARVYQVLLQDEAGSPALFVATSEGLYVLRRQ